jgi:glycosyltransferase involved in cell wall biosynthesis
MSFMRIAIDASGAAKAKRTGVARYIESLVKALLRVGPEHEYVLTVRLSRFKRRRYFLRPDAPNVRHRYLQEPFCGWIRRNADVFHGPDLRIPRANGLPLVSTIHDAFSLTSEMFASEEFRKKRGRLYRDALERSAAIITVSKASRDRLCAALDVPKERIRAVPLGIDDRFVPQTPEAIAAVRKRHDLPARYALFVGQVSRRKNVVRLVEAFSSLAESQPDLHLVLAGRASYGVDDTLASIEASPVKEKVHLTGHFPDEDLPGLYGGAEALALVSLDEGFGLPVVEAMGCGIPVVASTAGALPEVAGDAAVLVDPEDVDAIAVGLRIATADVDARRGLVERGARRAAELTWDRCAERTLDVYREVAGA